MMAVRKDREVSFRLSVGDLKPTEVTVLTYDTLGERTELPCKNQKRGIWATKEYVPKNVSQYSYLVAVGPKSNNAFIKKAKELLFSTTPYFEQRFRSLPENIHTCRDVFEPPPGTDFTSVFSGLTNCHLQNLVDSVKDINDLKRSLHELEHLSRVFNAQLFEDTVEVAKIRKWIGKPFQSYSQSPHKLVLMCALHGRLANELNLHIRDMDDITAHMYKLILGALENIERSELTKWSHERLRVTAIQTLEATKKDHWIYAATYFPYLFEVNRLMELSETMNGAKLQTSALTSLIIPRIQEGYKSRDDVDTILHNLVKTAKSAKQKTDVKEVVALFTKPAEPLVDISEKPAMAEKSITGHPSKGSPKSSAEVSKSEAWSTSVKKDNYASEGNIMESADIKYPPSSSTQDNRPISHAPNTGMIPTVEIEEATLPKDDMTSNPVQPLPDTASDSKLKNRLVRPTTEYDNGIDVDSNQACVTFQVVIREENVASVKLILKSETNGSESEHIMDIEWIRPNVFKKHIHTWRLAKKTISLPIREGFIYHYTIRHYITGSIKVDKEETYRRHVSPPRLTHDVFRNDNTSLVDEIVSQGTVVYADLIVPTVNSDSLRDDLILVEGVGFPGSLREPRQYQYINDVALWIQESIFPYLDSQLSDMTKPQIKYLAVLLGKLIGVYEHIDRRIFSDNCLKLIIRTLQMASADEFPNSVFKDISRVCLWLVNSVQGSWLYIWVYFHQLLDVDSLVNMTKHLSLQWTIRSWESDQQVLKEAIDTLKEKPILVEKLVIQCIEQVHDTRVLKEVLLAYNAVIPIEEGSDITNRAVNQLNKILKNKARRFSIRYKIWQDMISAKLTELANIARIHVVKHLTDQTWFVNDNEVIL
ncbi:uncharacterized protein [Amphiura filiformis]|uniref:uncharacterized protein n=1 Tax=Amphiura filiformis TaxID=82378 RepID=UPI003B215338